MGVISLLVEDEYQNFMHGRSGYLERRNANQRSYRKREASSLGGPPTKKSLTDDSNNDVQKLESTRATKVSAINLSGMQTKMIMGNFWPKHVYEVSEREREREKARTPLHSGWATVSRNILVGAGAPRDPLIPSAPRPLSRPHSPICLTIYCLE